MSMEHENSKKEGGYVFLSHSHLDIQQVRKIRNRMEEEGFEPLCFYLKCLNEDSELEELIEREIDAREWFVYVDSPNARKSDWVKKERAYIEKSTGKKIMVIELEQEDELEETADRIMNCMRVFLSYHHRDEQIVQRFQQEMVRRDLQVWWDADILAGNEWVEVIANRIKDASKRGGVVVFVSQHTMESVCQRQELKYALQQDSHILPVLIGDVKMDRMWEFLLHGRQWIQVDPNPTQIQIQHVVDVLQKMLLQRFDE